jgi:hypothetical protein
MFVFLVYLMALMHLLCFFKALPALTRDNGVVDIELRLWHV